ncbi:MAG: hypothetical protein INR62_07510 [Rhodospirillales bacterium]|nr:hypothetical protein [Acetobacter sp.]
MPDPDAPPGSAVPAVVPTAGIPATAAAELEAARAFAQAEKADATRRAYRSDFRIFAAWCEARGATPVPTSPEMVAAFLAAEKSCCPLLSTLRNALRLRYPQSLRGKIALLDKVRPGRMCSALATNILRRARFGERVSRPPRDGVQTPTQDAPEWKPGRPFLYRVSGLELPFRSRCL